MNGLVIAIDGPAASGKGTLARRLAAALGLAHLDTGLLYRAVARRVLDLGGDPADPVAAAAACGLLTAADLARSDLRTPDVDRAASRVSAIPAVRAGLLAFQRATATGAGAVLDGRDIGTVVFPEARVKLFLTASLAARAERRWRELAGRGLSTTREAVAADLAARDAADAARAIAPLRAAADAIALDTTDLDAETAFARALALIQAQMDAHPDRVA